MPECIDLDELERFESGQIDSETRIAEIGNHLSVCVICLQRLDDIAAHNRQLHSDHNDFSPDAGRRAYEATRRRRHSASKSGNQIPAPQDESGPTGEISEGPGVTIGKYRLLEQIGEGGFGVVYMAEQTAPVSRRVALKIIKPGMDTKQVIARFEVERQALAMMDHRNIARILDGGETESGRPFFVMELVQGLPITEFCQKSQLTTRQRLELFLSVCHAVQSAHQKRIIHRDIKPTNILVTMEGAEAVPKVIDFGIAKATDQHLTDKTLFTSFGQMIGTPSYMSPEQAGISNLDIDTRVDVYALGVLLYELLTGTTPFSNEDLRAAGPDMLRIITEREPEKPSRRISTLAKQDTASLKQAITIPSDRRPHYSTLAKLLRGDLDWITMKCLEKDRNRRYQTPDELAADVTRFLNNEAVLAVAPSKWYSFKKFAGRNKTALIAALLVSTALLAATLFSMRSASVARANAKSAEDSADAAELAKEKETAARTAAENIADAQRQQIYALDVYRASQFIKEGSRKAAHDLLNKQIPAAGQPDPRGFSWHYLKSQLRQSEQCKHTIEDSTDEVAVSATGQWIAYADKDRNTIVVREAVAPFRIIKQLPNPGVVIEFSKDDRYLLVATGQDGVRIYETDKWTEVKRWNNWTYPALFSPDGMLFGCKHHGDPQLHVYSTETWNEEFAVTMSDRGMPWWLRRHSVIFSPSGRYLIYPAAWGPKATEGTFSFFDVEQRTDNDRLSGKIPYGLAISISPDEKNVAVDNAEATKQIDIWDLAGEVPLRIKKLQQHRYDVSRVQYTPDGRYLISVGGDGQVVVWDAKQHELSHSLWGHLDQLWAMSVSPDSRTLVTGASREYPAIKVWDISESAMVDVSVPGRIVGLATDQKLLVTCDVTMARMWNRSGRPATTIKIAESFEQVGICLANLAPAWDIDGSGSKLVVGYRDGKVRTWNVASGKELIQGSVPTGYSVTGVASHPTRRDAMIVVAHRNDRDEDGKNHDHCRVLLWDIAHQKVIRELLSLSQTVCYVSVSPDGNQLAVCEFRKCHVYSLPNMKKLFEFEGQKGGNGKEPAQPLWAKPAFSPDGDRIALSVGHVVYTLDSSTGKILNELRGHALGVFSIQFASDGNTLITSNDSVKLWHLPTSTDVITLPGGNSLFTRISSTSSGHRLFIASGMFNRRVRAIDIPVPTETSFRQQSSDTANRNSDAN